MTDRPRRSKAAPYHHGDLANALVAAGVTMVEEGGGDATGLRDLARRTKVSAAAVYRHFANKDALLAAVAAEGFAMLNADFRAALETAPPSPAARLTAVGQAYIAFALARPGLYRLMFGANRPSAAADSRFAEEAKRARATLTALVAGCCEPGASPEAVAAGTVSAWSLVHGYVQLTMEGHFDASGARPDPVAVLAGLRLSPSSV